MYIVRRILNQINLIFFFATIYRYLKILSKIIILFDIRDLKLISHTNRLLRGKKIRQQIIYSINFIKFRIDTLI